MSLTYRIKRYASRLRSDIKRYVYSLPTVSLDEIAPNHGPSLSPIEEDQNLPPRPDRDLFHDDVGALVRVVDTVRPERAVELGTGRGNATANICKFSDVQVITVNALPEDMSGNITTFALGKDEIGRAYRSQGFEDRVTQVYANTLNLDLLKYAEKASVDFALIDACHDTEYVLHDFDLVRPVLRPGAVVLMHDTHPSCERHLEGSYDACVELRRRGFDVQHIKETWWGYWKKPKE